MNTAPTPALQEPAWTHARAARPAAPPEGPPEDSPAAFPEAFFLPVRAGADGAWGQRLCLFHPPAPQANGPRARVLYLHPLAEELNTSRRTVAQQARALARAGLAVLQIDLLGCGDSSGRFEDARWSDWLHDAQAALDWLDQRMAAPDMQPRPGSVGAPAPGPLWLWGLRCGALLAAELARQLALRPERANPELPTLLPNRLPHLLFWQPNTSGQQALQQFLRLHAAAQWLQADAPVSTTGPAQALARGEGVDIAGYRLSPALAAGLRAAQLTPPALAASDAAPPRLVWIHCAPPGAAAPQPAALQAWRDAGWQVQAQTVQGPAFWQTVGFAEAPALLQATTAALGAQAPVSVELERPVC